MRTYTNIEEALATYDNEGPGFDWAAVAKDVSSAFAAATALGAFTLWASYWCV